MLKKSVGVLLSIAILLSIFAVSGTAVTASAATGKWELVQRRYYAYDKNSAGVQYVDKQDSNYKYVCQYKGATSDGYVSFLASGGYQQGPSGTATHDVYHDCSTPKTSYSAGAKATLKIRITEKNVVGWIKGVNAYAYISKYNAAKEGDGYFNNNAKLSDFLYTKNSSQTIFVETTGKTTVTAHMPKTAKNGDKIAIVFVAATAYDGWSMAKSSDFGGNMFYEWVYQYKAAKSNKPAATKIKKLTPIEKGFNIKWKKVKGVKGYQVQWSTSKKFSKGKVKKALTTATSGRIVRLKAKKKYYVRVRTYKIKKKKKVYSAWSEVMTNKTK